MTEKPVSTAKISPKWRGQFALPGGTHDRTVRTLSKALPAAILAIAAGMIVTPLFSRGEISFLLDRDKADVTEHRINTDMAVYRGEDSRGRPFMIQASSAVQPLSSEPVVNLGRVTAQIDLTNGPARVEATNVDFNYDTNRIFSHQEANLTTYDGYQVTMNEIEIDLHDQIAIGRQGVTGEGPAGTFSADNARVDLDNRTILLEGRARLNMDPSQIRKQK